MRIVIPTYRRTNRQLTLSAIPASWLKQTVLVVDRQDAKELENYCNLVVHPPSVKTIAQKRAWILKTFSDEKILMLDDDLRFAVREYTGQTSAPPYVFRLVKATAKDISRSFSMVERFLDSYAHVGIGARGGNNGMNRIKGWNHNYRMMYALGYHVPTVREHCKLGRIEHREDMELCLQLLTKGFANAVLIDTVVDQVYNAKGGASEERSVEASNADATKLAELFPEFVKVVQKEYKSSVPRLEVVCAWKKAYAKGVERFGDRGPGRPSDKVRGRR